MSTGDARHSQLAIALIFGRKHGESSSQRSNKTHREEIKDPNIAVIVCQGSTATITDKTVNTNPNLLSPFSVQTYHRNSYVLVIKLKRLKEDTQDTLHIKVFCPSALTTNLFQNVLKLHLNLEEETMTKALSIIVTPNLKISP